jgi:molybdate transport system ATP-binding protein
MILRLHGTVRRGELDLDMDLELEAGVTMVSGANGAGKTTLLRIIAGLEALDSGSLHLAGDPVDIPAAATFVATHERPVAMAFQDHRLFRHLSVLDNVAFPFRRRGLGREQAREQARPHLASMGLDDHATKRPGTLSIGQRQRCALARALATPADILLLDEPLASIDDDSKSAIREQLRELDHRCVVWVTHDPADAFARPDPAGASSGAHIAIVAGRVRQTLG